MSMSNSTGKTTVSGSVTTTVTSLGIVSPGAGQTLKSGYVAGTGSAQTLFTPTAAKTFYLMGFSVDHTAAAYAQVYKADGSTIMTEARCAANANGVIPYGCPAEAYTTANPLKGIGTASAIISYWGYEQ